MSGISDWDFMLQQMMAFAVGGIAGSGIMWLMLLHDVCDNMTFLPWRVKSGAWKFFGFMDLMKGALKAEAGFREAYGYTLVSTMRELGGPRPLPQTDAAMDALLAEAERRFQLLIKGGKQ
jgi:hypothetical protein